MFVALFIPSRGLCRQAWRSPCAQPGTGRWCYMLLLMSFISSRTVPTRSVLCKLTFRGTLLLPQILSGVIVLQDNISWDGEGLCMLYLLTFKNTVWSCKINIFKDAECWGISFRSWYNIQGLNIISGYFHNLSRKDFTIVPWKRNTWHLEMSWTWMIVSKYKQDSTARKKCFWTA